jgi:allantoin racemase
MKLCIIFPQPESSPYAGSYIRKTILEVKKVLKPDTDLEVVPLDGGSETIESIYDSEFSEPWILRKALAAEADGSDSIIIDYVLEGALDAVREALAIPVIGPTQVSLSVASSLSDKFSIVTFSNQMRRPLTYLARKYGFEKKLASIRTLNMNVPTVLSNADQLRTRILEESKLAIRDDGAESIILGMTGFVGIAGSVANEVGVPMIDPVLSSAKFAELLMGLNLSQSKITYPKPRMDKSIR